jgi:hypothetical protein
MTCLEKLKQTHPELDDEGIKGLVEEQCPNNFGIMSMPDHCDPYVTCDKCWNREIPGTEPEPTTPVIKDSGERRQFDTGAVRDIQEGKGRMDLLPWAAVMEISKHCEAGALKYGEHNVDKGIPTHSLCDSAARHLAKYLDGWKDEPHLLDAAWNLLWAIQMELKKPEMVDTPWKNDVKED